MSYKIQNLPIDQLVINPDNPRLIRDKHFKNLVKSLADCPLLFDARPCICSNRTGQNVILGGNMRFQVAKELKYKEVPVIIMSGLTPDQEREIAIKDNGSFGEWDFDLLSAWDDLPLVEWGVDLPEDWLNEPTGEPADAEPLLDKATELQKIWKTETGQLWQIGNHRLLVGDSTKAEDVARVMGGDKADMVFTDPPYGVAVNTGSKKDLKVRNRRTDGATISNDAMKPEDFKIFILAAFQCMNQAIKDGGVLYICHAEALGMDVIFRSAFAEAGFKPAEIIVWVKDVFAFGRQDYHWRHEPIIYGWKEGAAHFFIDDHTQDTVWNIPRPKRSEEHPTMKPMELPQKAITNSSRTGEFVFDPFLGSGTTMIACQNLNRKCRGIEISPEYCSVVLDRMKTAFPDIDIRKA